MIALATESLRTRCGAACAMSCAMIAAVVGFGDARAATRIVPNAYPTIQAGINAAVHGDTVLVRPGTYTGSGNRDIKFNGKRIVVRSEMGAESTIVDCQGSAAEPHRGFTFSNGETNESVLDGFTIQNGYAGSGGGAIYLVFSPIVRNCIVLDCVAPSGVIYCGYDQAIIERCTIRNNIGMGIYISGEGLVDNCSIIDNEGTGIGAIELYGVGKLRGCTIAGNTGVGILLNGGEPVVRDCVITGTRGIPIDSWYNKSVIEGCTIVGNDDPVVLTYAEATFRRTIIRDNCGTDVHAHSGTLARFECCAVKPSDIEGEGGIVYSGPQVTQDPQLCSPISCQDAPSTQGDFHLADTSPCLPENSPCGTLIGALGIGCSPSAIPGGNSSGIAKLGQVRIFPNPVLSDGILMLSIETGESGTGLAVPEGSPVELVVFDASGRERVRTRQDFRRDGITFDPGSLEAGAYFVRVSADGAQAIGRFLRLR